MPRWKSCVKTGDDVMSEDQLELIDVEPENSKTIQRHARAYKRAQKARMEALDEETKQKEKLLVAIREGKIRPQGGCYYFRTGKLRIKITPRDNLLVTVKEDAGPADEEE
jgi:hypothetical protein